jgi:RIO-like serine/threonine protein kinase
VSFDLDERVCADRPLAHSDAYKAGILHRDISPGNIIIGPKGGLLIDWDLSKPIQTPSKPETPRRVTRTVKLILSHATIIADT